MKNVYFYRCLEEKIPNTNTKKNYEHRMNSLLKHMNGSRDADGEKIKGDVLVANIMTHPRHFFPLLQKSYTKDSTLKNMLTLILTLFKHSSFKCDYESSYDKWKEFHDIYSKQEKQMYNSNIASNTQKDKIVTFEEMKGVVDKIDNPHKTLKSSMEYCVLNMYMEIIPKRADFGQIRVYLKDKQSTDKNYVVLDSNDSYFVLNHYNKTQKDKTETLKEPVTDRLRRVFKQSLHHFPRKYLFVGQDNEPFKTSNAYTKFVIKTYEKYLGKKIGVSMIRHIFINEKVDLNTMTVEEKDKIAKAMGHSRRQQEQYKIK
jgi:hypothetical protein